MADAPIPPYLEALNPEQRQAVLHTGRPLLILAGAGSGKTRVITTKIAWLIREQGIDPRSILAVTFTNKAAREMAERARLIDDRAGMAMLRTFHSFGAWFLRRNGALGGLDPNFVIYDDENSEALIRSILKDPSKAEVKHAVRSIARAKDYFLSPEDPELDLIDYLPEFRRIYARYEERLAQIGNVDFGDLIKKPVEILRANPEVAGRLRDRFRVIMVDEYQDSNVAQLNCSRNSGSPRPTSAWWGTTISPFTVSGERRCETSWNSPGVSPGRTLSGWNGTTAPSPPSWTWPLRWWTTTRAVWGKP